MMHNDVEGWRNAAHQCLSSHIESDSISNGVGPGGCDNDNGQEWTSTTPTTTTAAIVTTTFNNSITIIKNKN